MKPFQSTMIFLLVFFCGFANLATEIIGPRLIASIFGSTTAIWAIIISVTLLGISIGYYAGGRVSYEGAKRWLPVLLLVNSFWLIAISWIVWWIPNQIPQVAFEAAGINYSLIILISMAAFLVPAVLFSMVLPIAITLISKDGATRQVSKTVGNVYALGTVGSVSGALAAAFYLIPWVGLSSSLRWFAIILIAFAAFFWKFRKPYILVFLFILCLIIPQPAFEWDIGLKLLLQREGFYETIRVFSDESTFVRFHLGPSYESEMDIRTNEPRIKYARQMVGLVGDASGKRVLIIGGAGHSIARALENRGALVTEVEIDPIVVQVSDELFGPIQGEVIVTDGRTYINRANPHDFDHVLVDAFSGPAFIPPQLTTLEFFESVQKALKPGGTLIYNFIGYDSGPKSESFFALSATMAAVFEDVRLITEDVPIKRNILFVASPSAMPDAEFEKAPVNGYILTDNLNPIEILFEKAQ